MENPTIRARFRAYLETPDKLAMVKKHSLDEQTQKDVLAIAYSPKGEILHV